MSKAKAAQETQPTATQKNGLDAIPDLVWSLFAVNPAGFARRHDRASPEMRCY